jgi:hypothetical protein
MDLHGATIVRSLACRNAKLDVHPVCGEREAPFRHFGQGSRG